MADFDKAFAHLMGAEGRKYTNDPDDRGGPTKFGITLSTLLAWRGPDPAVTALDVQTLTEDEAKKIYRARYWDALKLDAVTDDVVATIVFDQAVNRGVGTVARQVQQAVNALTPVGPPIKVDGSMGNVTLAAVNAVNPVWFCQKFLELSKLAYLDIVNADIKQTKFLKGWLNRLTSLAALLPADKSPQGVA